MKTLMATFLMLAMLMAFAIADLSPTPYEEEPFLTNDHENTTTTITSSETKSRQLTTSLRGKGRFLASRGRGRPNAVMTCDKYPKVCRARGSGGPDCCKKKCVDSSTDRLNCGKCGKKCKFSEICCKGKCVNPRADKRNCGGCNSRCKKGSSCVLGMCSYA